MKKILHHLALPVSISLLIVGFMMTSAVMAQQKAFEDGIIAVVNNELITYKDLQDYIQTTYAQLSTERFPPAELEKIRIDLQKNGINKLIEDKLIISKANALKLEVREKLVDDRVAEIKAKYPNENAFLESITQNGVTITDIRNKILDQFKIKYVIEHEVKSKIYVNPQEVTDFYAKNGDKFQKAERVNLNSIFIAFKQDRAAAYAKANEALDKIHAGDDFDVVAKLYSEGTPIGIVERGQLAKDIEDKVFALSVGETTNLVETSNGVYIFELLGKIPPEKAAFKEVKDDIYQFIYKKKFKDRFEAWLAKLKKDAFIEIKN